MAGSEVEELQARLEFLMFVLSEVRSTMGKQALETAWHSLMTEPERQALLLWLPSALPVLSPDALSYGFLELTLKTCRWEALTIKQARQLRQQRHHLVPSLLSRYWIVV